MACKRWEWSNAGYDVEAGAVMTSKLMNILFPVR